MNGTIRVALGHTPMKDRSLNGEGVLTGNAMAGDAGHAGDPDKALTMCRHFLREGRALGP